MVMSRHCLCKRCRSKLDGLGFYPKKHGTKTILQNASHSALEHPTLRPPMLDQQWRCQHQGQDHAWWKQNGARRDTRLATRRARRDARLAYSGGGATTAWVHLLRLSLVAERAWQTFAILLASGTIVFLPSAFLHPIDVHAAGWVGKTIVACVRAVGIVLASLIVRL